MVRLTGTIRHVGRPRTFLLLGWVGSAGAVVVFFFAGENELAKQARRGWDGDAAAAMAFCSWDSSARPTFLSICLFSSSCTWIPPFFLVHPVPAAAVAFTCFSSLPRFSAKMWRRCCLPLRAIYPPVRPGLRLGRQLISLVPLSLLVCSCHIGFGFVSVFLHGGLSCLADRCRGQFCVCIRWRSRGEGVATVGWWWAGEQCHIVSGCFIPGAVLAAEIWLHEKRYILE
jgi:hypothetical protein